MLEVSQLVEWSSQASNPGSLISEALTTVAVPLCLEGSPWLGEEQGASKSSRAGLVGAHKSMYRPPVMK